MTEITEKEMYNEKIKRDDIWKKQKIKSKKMYKNVYKTVR